MLGWVGRLLEMNSSQDPQLDGRGQMPGAGIGSDAKRRHREAGAACPIRPWPVTAVKCHSMTNHSSRAGMPGGSWWKAVVCAAALMVPSVLAQELKVDINNNRPLAE
jgi:hypothetical protein